MEKIIGTDLMKNENYNLESKWKEISCIQ